jgi:hypothetical protein
MKPEELIQKLSDVYPWRVHDVENILGVKLPKSEKHHSSFISEQQIAYEGGLLINEVEVRITARADRAGETVRLILNLADDAACFTRKRIEQTYPGLFLTNAPHGHSLEEEANFSSKQSWGRLSFGFKEKRRDCLSSIIFIPEWDD